MKAHISQDVQEVMEAVHYRPSITLLVPCKARIGMKEEMQQYLKLEADKIRKQLSAEYPADVVSLVMKKMNSLFAGIEYDEQKKSIAFFVSPVFSKLFYLDVPVEEKLIIDEMFEIRDLVYSRKRLGKYLLLVLGAKELAVYLIDAVNWVKILVDTDQSLSSAADTPHDKVANFSDNNSMGEKEIQKFLHYADRVLKTVLDTHQLPLLVMGDDKIIGYFRKITRYAENIVEYIHGDHLHDTVPHLQKIIQPYLRNRDRVLQQQVYMQLEDAASRDKLVTGIKNVWQEAKQKNAKLLVVERNYMYYAEVGGTGLQERDKVDEVIRYVQECGGDVAFVDQDVLSECHHIALIRYH